MDSGDTRSVRETARHGQQGRPESGTDRDPPVEGPEVSVTCDATAESLQLVHEAMSRFWDLLALAPADDWRLLFELAVSEVAANIVEHARPQAVDLRLTERAGCVVAEFTDSGNGWSGSARPGNVLEPTEPDLDLDLPERGRGLALARTAVDEVAYERIGDVNRWRLLKWL